MHKARREKKKSESRLARLLHFDFPFWSRPAAALGSVLCSAQRRGPSKLLQGIAGVQKALRWRALYPVVTSTKTTRTRLFFVTRRRFCDSFCRGPGVTIRVGGDRGAGFRKRKCRPARKLCKRGRDFFSFELFLTDGEFTRLSIAIVF